MTSAGQRFAVGILDDYQHAALASADWSDVQARCDVVVLDRPVEVERLKAFDALCIMRERTPFPRETFEALPRLKLLVTTGGGNAAVDLRAAADHGVVVCGTRNGDGRRATAELAWGLVLAGVRDLDAQMRAVREGGWQTGLGEQLWGRTLGLLGLGHIGTMMAGYGRAFGMEVIAWSDNLTEDRAAAVGARRVDRDELFRRADVLSIHQVLSDRTHAGVGRRELALMKPTAVLVNTSRGPIIDEAALLAALDAGRPWRAALDVFAQEPLPPDHPFRSHPGVVATPHIGYVEREVYRTFHGDSVAAVEAFLDGRAPDRLLTPAGETLAVP